MKPINLAKCKIGQRVRLRDGRDYTFDGLSDDRQYPFQLKEIDNLYTKRGGYFLKGESDNDIIAILPLPKKKAKTATHMGRKADISENRQDAPLNVSAAKTIAKAQLETAKLRKGIMKTIKTLQALLK